MKGTNDDYDDDFEDYENDDFEDDSEQLPNKTNINNNVAPPKLATSVTAIHDSKISNSKYITSSQDIKSDTQSKMLNDTKIIKNNDKIASSYSTSSRVKKFDNMQISFSQTLSDPRTIRIKKLIDSGVLDLQMERFTQCHILPTTKYEFYINAMRTSTCNLRQIGVPMDLEKRDMNTETEIIENADKSMQFSYGHDDTEFYNLLQDIQLQKKGTANHKHRNYDRDSNQQKQRSNEAIRKTDVELDAQDISENTAMESLDVTTSVGEGATRLTSFLQRASLICEGILQDEAEDYNNRIQNNNKEKNIRSEQQQVFDSDSDWIQLGKDVTKGSNEPVRTRSICYLRFSQLQPNLVMSAHPYPVLRVNSGNQQNEEELDLKPFKGLYSVWDVAYPGCPLYVLEATGQPTCCCFSNTQSHLVIAGTNEGTLHLWDLRENASFHKDRDSIDLRIDRGIRKPSYSTNLSYSSASSTQGYTSSSGDSNTESSLDDFQHSAPILQIESLSPYDLSTSMTTSSSAMGIISQFVSIDESGLVIFWTTSQTQRTNQDLQCSPWAGVALIQTRQLRHLNNHPSRPFLSTSTLSVHKGEDNNALHNHTDGTSIQSKSLLAIIPEDVSTILITKSNGTISKLTRFGQPNAPHTLHRSHDYSTNIAISSSDYNRNNKDKITNVTREVNYFSAISCIAVRSHIHDTSATTAVSLVSQSLHDIIESKNNNEKGATIATSSAALILVGRYDGTVDLFQVDVEHPIQSWDLNCFATTTTASSTTTKITSSSHNANDKQTSVVMLQWCSSRASVYFATDSNGNIFYFDLNQNSHSPITVESIKITNKLIPGLIDISKCVPNTGLFNIIVSAPNLKSEGDSIRTRRGNRNIAKVDQYQSQQQLLREEISLRSSLYRLSTEKFSIQSVTFTTSTSNHTAYESSDHK